MHPLRDLPLDTRRLGAIMLKCGICELVSCLRPPRIPGGTESESFCLSDSAPSESRDTATSEIGAAKKSYTILD